MTRPPWKNYKNFWNGVSPNKWHFIHRNACSYTNRNILYTVACLNFQAPLCLEKVNMIYALAARELCHFQHLSATSHPRGLGVTDGGIIIQCRGHFLHSFHAAEVDLWFCIDQESVLLFNQIEMNTFFGMFFSFSSWPPGMMACRRHATLHTLAV